MAENRDFTGQATDREADNPLQTDPAPAGGEVGSAGTTLKEQAVDTGQKVLAQTKDTAGRMIDQAKDQIKSQIETHKGKTADGLSSALRAIESTGQQFRNEDLAFVANYTDSFAGQIRRASDYLNERGVDDIARDVETFARKNPSLFIGGAFVIGMALARFLKSSELSTPFAAFSDERNALVPVNPSLLSSPMTNPINSPVTSPVSGASQDVFGERSLTAPSYVPGVGVSGTGNGS